MMRRSLGQGLCVGLLVVAVGLAGCSGDDGSPGASTGTLTGMVTNGANANAPVANATIVTTPAIPGTTITTNAAGTYTVQLPVGNYMLEVRADNFVAEDAQASVLAAVSQTIDFELAPVSPVVVEVTGAPTDAVPGSQFQLTANAMPMDGSTVQGYAWTQTNSAQATIDGGNTANPTITLGDVAAYKQALIDHLPVLDRFEILGIDPHAFELGAMVAFEVEVTTTSGTYTHEVEVHADVDFADWATGLRNVPIGVPVLLGGADQATYNWTLSRPSGSNATLMDADTRFPYFTPDVGGAYSVTETNAAVTIEISAGEWWGGIESQNAEGRPVTICQTACHATALNDKFVDWANSGHAEIFTNSINTNDHYGEGCLVCHTVGYGSGGFDSTDDYQGFLDAMFPGGQAHADPDNWNEILANWPEQAAYANIQCDSCHGPTGQGSAHTTGDKRISVSSAVCATCHGEPPRHGRYQQWLESGHGNFETAIGQVRGSCAKCHTAQGFLDWYRNNLLATYNPPNVDPAEAQPITCVVCHDPHNVGRISGDNNDVTLRVEGDTPELPAGFTAVGVGKGAMCIVCHNTRRGEVEAVITSAPDQAPHGGAQGDVMMGQNAFWVSSGVRGPHSLIVDTCSNCHLERSPPPAEFSYQFGGTNHTFEANVALCSDCHGGFDPASLIAITENALHNLQDKYEEALRAEIAFHTSNGREVEVTGTDAAGAPLTVVIGATSVVGEILFEESHGRAAMSIDVDNGSGVIHVGHCRLNSDTQILVSGTPDGRLLSNTFSTADDVLARAQWNYFLIHADSSGGIHNPGWVTQILAATNAELDTIIP